MLILEYKLKKKKTKGGITAMSLVDDPAIMIDFLKLNKEEPLLLLSVDVDQQIVTGPALIPNLKIFRTATSLGMPEDGYIFFSESTVKDMAELFMTNEYMNKITLDHETKSGDLKLIESWIVIDNKNDKSLALGFEVPNGTWMISYKVEDPELWTKIKANKYNGFSIEAFDFDREIVEMANQDIELSDEEIDSILYEYITKEISTLKLATPNPGESEENFIPRCITTVMNEGTTSDNKKAYGICKAIWDNK